MILDLSHFDDRPYRIPNQQESRDLKEFMEKNEVTLLRELLGNPLYLDFMAGLETSGEIEQIWIDLRDGADYGGEDGNQYHFDGLIEVLKPAIYSLWIPQNAYKFTNIGMVNNNAPQQATTIDNTPDIVNAWNDYCIKVGAYWTGAMLTRSRVNSFYGFMKENSANYSGWTLCEPKAQNRFSL